MTSSVIILYTCMWERHYFKTDQEITQKRLHTNPLQQSLHFHTLVIQLEILLNVSTLKREITVPTKKWWSILVQFLCIFSDFCWFTFSNGNTNTNTEDSLYQWGPLAECMLLYMTQRPLHYSVLTKMCKETCSNHNLHTQNIIGL